MAANDETREASLGLTNVAPAAQPAEHAPAITRWFNDRFPTAPVVRVDNFMLPSEGLSNETVLFDVTTSGAEGEHVDRYVARIQAAGQPLAPPQTDRCSSSIEFEYHLQRAAGSKGACPVAPLIGFEPSTEYFGRPFFVMRQVEGRVPGVQPSFHTEGFMKDEASVGERRHLVETTLAAMAALHAQNWRETELVELFDVTHGDPDRHYQLDIYRNDFDAQLAGRSFDLITQTLDWLSRTTPDSETIGIVWGDARLGNVICNSRYEPAALLDWENGFVGPIEADMGWWLVSERVNHDILGIPRLTGYPEYDEHLALYSAAAGRSIGDVRYWEVLAALRMAHGVLRLADRMQASGALPPDMANLGFENPITAVLGQLLAQR